MHDDKAESYTTMSGPTQTTERPQHVFDSLPIFPKRPDGSNADEWHLFLTCFLDCRATSPNGLTYMAVQIAEALDEAFEDGRRDGEQHALERANMEDDAGHD
jgi:hypothetical protein